MSLRHAPSARCARHAHCKYSTMIQWKYLHELKPPSERNDGTLLLREYAFCTESEATHEAMAASHGRSTRSLSQGRHRTLFHWRYTHASASQSNSSCSRARD